jgi:hypothetical protein
MIGRVDFRRNGACTNMSGRKSFKIRFESRTHARTVVVNHDMPADEVRNRLGLPLFDRCIMLHAGADGSTEELLKQLEPTFVHGLAPFMSRHNIPVIDGATRAGFVGMMGKSRAATGGTFPLIGVAPFDVVLYPGGSEVGHRVPLDEYHTHFVLVRGGGWGVESDILIGLGRILAKQSVALLINGGEIVRKEARMHARAGTPLLVLEGSGRVADQLVDALKRGTSDNVLRETIQIGVVRTCTPQTLLAELKDLLDIEDES